MIQNRGQIGPGRTIIPLSAWFVAGVEAFLGWLLAVAALVLGLRPLGWVLGGAAWLSLCTAPAHAIARRARGKRAQALERTALVFALIMLEWPVLSVATVIILSYAGVLRWE
jgi:hypothetical protein